MIRTSTIAALSLLMLPGCESPWDSAAGTVHQRASVTHRLVARDAGLGKWIDKRPKGQITHGMLVIDGPLRDVGYHAPGTAVEISTTSDVAADKIRALLAEEIPTSPGAKLHFALGRTESVRIERIGEGGARTLVAEGRVSFLEISPR